MSQEGVRNKTIDRVIERSIRNAVAFLENLHAVGTKRLNAGAIPKPNQEMLDRIEIVIGFLLCNEPIKAILYDIEGYNE